MAEDQTRQVELGRALRNLRKSLGLSVYQVARRMGYEESSASNIARWEQGKIAFSSGRLWAYLDALGLTFAHLDHELNPAPGLDLRLLEIAERIDSLV